jgi:hypothetical protein
VQVVTRPTDDEPPYLDCPECGEPLFQATAWCSFGWGWCETFEVTTCQCGARCTVNVDEDRAYVHLEDDQDVVTP